MKNLNIIYMHTHDSGRFWSPYGYSVPTPNIMKFAEQGTVFRHCYCAGPTCSPSRAALLTGINPHSNGMQGLASRGWQLNDYKHHLAPYLAENGYTTTLCGIQHVAPDHNMIGYHTVIGSQEFSMDSTEESMEDWDYNNTDAACTFIREYQDDKPFFLAMGWFNTHREYPKASSKFNADYISVPAPLYDCDQNRKDMAEYHESVRVVDNCVGKIMKELEDNGMMSNSIIILTTDHGIAFPKMKCTLYDTGIGVGLIMSYPENISQGCSIDSLVSHLDIFPTLCDLTKIKKPRWLEGFSMLPLFEKKTKKIRDEIFSEVTYHAAYEPKRCIRTDRFKLIKFFDFHNKIVPANIDEALSKDFLMENGYSNKICERELLFDLWLDAYECENLINDSGYADIYTELSQKLSNWMIETNDPLIACAQRVAKPAGARVNKLSCENPRLPDFEN